MLNSPNCLKKSLKSRLDCEVFMAFNWVFLKSETKFSCYEMKLYFSRLA